MARARAHGTMRKQSTMRTNQSSWTKDGSLASRQLIERICDEGESAVRLRVVARRVTPRRATATLIVCIPTNRP